MVKIRCNGLGWYGGTTQKISIMLKIRWDGWKCIKKVPLWCKSAEMAWDCASGPSKKSKFWGISGPLVCTSACGAPKNSKFWDFFEKIGVEVQFCVGVEKVVDDFGTWRSWNGGRLGVAWPKWLNGKGPEIESVNHPHLIVFLSLLNPWVVGTCNLRQKMDLKLTWPLPFSSKSTLYSPSKTREEGVKEVAPRKLAVF